MPASEPRTHYQVSFTSRQAVLLFVVVLVSLAGAYLLGLLTGLAGRQPADSVAAAEPAPTAKSATAAATVPDTAPAPATPAPRRTPAGEATARPPALAAREPGTSGDLQFFEDRPEETPETLGFWGMTLVMLGHDLCETHFLTCERGCNYWL